MTVPISVTSGDLVRQFGRWQDHATGQPVLVTHHGRERVVLLSAPRYRELVAAPTVAALPAQPPLPDIVLLGQAMEHVTQGFVAFAADMIVTAINRAACCFLRTARESVVGFRLDEKLPGIQETLGYASLSRAAKSGAILTFEMPSFAFPGRWLLVQTFPLADGVACLFRDITDEVEARRRFDRDKARAAAVAAHGGIGRATLSLAGTFAEVDGTTAGFLGFAAEDLKPLRLVDLLCGPGRAAATAGIEAVLNGGAPWAGDVQLLDRSGAGRALRLALAPLRTQGSSDGACLTATAA